VLLAEERETHRLALETETASKTRTENKLANFADLYHRVHDVTVQEDTLDNESLASVEKNWRAELKLRDERKQAEFLKQFSRLQQREESLSARVKDIEGRLTIHAFEQQDPIIDGLIKDNAHLKGERDEAFKVIADREKASSKEK